jgi:hypothetical protein
MADKTTFQELRDAAARWKKKADDVRGQAEEIAGEVIATVGVAGGSAAAGFLDELKGESIGHGIRQHKIGSVPTSLGAGALLEGAAAFGMFGKYSRIGYAVGQGAVGAFANTMGRLAGANMREKGAELSKTEAPKAAAPAPAPAKTGTEG